MSGAAKGLDSQKPPPVGFKRRRNVNNLGLLFQHWFPKIPQVRILLTRLVLRPRRTAPSTTTTTNNNRTHTKTKTTPANASQTHDEVGSSVTNNKYQLRPDDDEQSHSHSHSHAKRHCILVMGGSFNPVHRGHIATMAAAKRQAERQNFFVEGAYLAVAHDAHVRQKCKDQAIPARWRIAFCNAAASEVEGGWLFANCERVHGSAHEMAKRVLAGREREKVVTMIVCGSDKLKSHAAAGGGKGKRKFRKKKNKTRHNDTLVAQKLYFSRDGGVKGKPGGVLLGAVCPGLSSSVVRERLVASPGVATVRKVVGEKMLSKAVGDVIEANSAELARAVPVLFNGK